MGHQGDIAHCSRSWSDRPQQTVTTRHTPQEAAQQSGGKTALVLLQTTGGGEAMGLRWLHPAALRHMEGVRGATGTAHATHSAATTRP